MRKLPTKLFAILLLVVFVSMANITYVSADTLVDTPSSLVPTSAAGNPNTIDFTPVTNIPLLSGWNIGETINAEVGASNVFNELFSLSIRIGAMLAVFMFIWGGLNMIMARDNASNITEGKKKMKNAILGLLMLLSTFVVLNTINPNLVNISLFGDSTARLSDTTDSTNYYNQVESWGDALKSGNIDKICSGVTFKCYSGQNAVNDCLTASYDDVKLCQPEIIPLDIYSRNTSRASACYNSGGIFVTIEDLGNRDNFGYCIDIPQNILQERLKNIDSESCEKIFNGQYITSGSRSGGCIINREQCADLALSYFAPNTDDPYYGVCSIFNLY